MDKGIRQLFALAALILIPVEILCVESSLETQGEVLQGLLGVMVGLNLVPIVAFWWFPRTAVGVLLGFFLLIVPYQLALLNRLTRINHEVMRIVDSRIRLRATGAHLPATLDDYVFQDASIRKYIYDYSVSEDANDFSLTYFVVDRGISHSYSTKHGWGYYPD